MTRRYCPSDLSRSELAAEARAEAIEAAAEEMNAEIRQELNALRADYDATRLALEHAHDALLNLETRTAVYDTLHTSPSETCILIGLLHVTAVRGREAAANTLENTEAE